MQVTRRDLLRTAALGVAAAAVPDLWLPGGAWATTPGLVKGLFEEGTGTYPPSVVNVSCNALWKDLQPTKGGPIAANNSIDKFLASGRPGRVRLFFGKESPTWAINLAGGVKVHDPVDNITAVVPRWWTSSVINAQKDFVSKLAAKYDGRISAIFISNGGTVYAEPFIRGIGSSLTRQNLLAAGYTPAADKASYVAGLQMFSAFKQTRLAMSFNPWEYINSMTNFGEDVSFTIQMMDRMRTLYGSRAIWCNCSVKWPLLGGQYTTMYAHMKGQKPLTFQTAQAPRVGNFPNALTWTVGMGAHAVELPQYFWNYLSGSQLSSFNTKLRAQ
ncbi:MAG TPA: twin-arginine translocation signal domain-containing protein [Gaiellales bacterium]|nr:twin-arginine translocation signal domain-containing protein [Gaiellales bacterium]